MKNQKEGGWRGELEVGGAFFFFSLLFLLLSFLFSLSLSAAACVLRPSLGGAGKRAQEREREGS